MVFNKVKNGTNRKNISNLSGFGYTERTKSKTVSKTVVPNIKIFEIQKSSRKSLYNKYRKTVNTE